MNSNLATIEHSNFKVINSKFLTDKSGYARCVKFWFHGFDHEGILPIFTLHITDNLFLKKKVRQELLREITDNIIDNRENYEI